LDPRLPSLYASAAASSHHRHPLHLLLLLLPPLVQRPLLLLQCWRHEQLLLRSLLPAAPAAPAVHVP
jgi:hypothetical protein